MLEESSLDDSPWPLFHRWLSEAEQAQLPDFNAMLLATSSLEGRPSARVVLLRGHDERGFTFYTNYLSRKAGELAVNPFAALTFAWAPMARQVRIEGAVEKVTPAESDAYFASRPKGHRLGALISPQSKIIPDRAFLELRMAELVRQYQGTDDVPRPESWGGYRVIPQSIEFWQGQENRLHDRILYTRSSQNWIQQRLAP